MLGLYGAQNAFLQDLTFSRFYNSPVGDNQRLRSAFFMLGLQIFVQCASTWAAASAGGEPALDLLGVPRVGMPPDLLLSQQSLRIGVGGDWRSLPVVLDFIDRATCPHENLRILLVCFLRLF